MVTFLPMGYEHQITAHGTTLTVRDRALFCVTERSCRKLAIKNKVISYGKLKKNSLDIYFLKCGHSAFNLNVLEGKKEASTKSSHRTSETFSCHLEAGVEQAATALLSCSEGGCYQFASGIELRGAWGRS